MRTDIFEILDSLSSSPHKNVLATIVDVNGSAYRKEGAMMLFQENDTQVGLLSGGCLEVDLKARISEGNYQPHSQFVTYDLSGEDDLSWGQGTGCNGVVKVLIESLSPKLINDLVKVRDYVNDGLDVKYVRSISKAGKVLNYIFSVEKKQKFFGDWKGSIPDFDSLKEDKLVENDISESFLYFKTIRARSRIIIYGAGPDAVPLVILAKQLGYQTIVVDWRPEYCSEEYFPDADDRIIAFPQEVEKKLCLRETDSFVLMTHSYEKDKELINQLLLKQINYVGLLGSRTRAERLLTGMEIPPSFHYPIGLPIGAEGPNEIAISIIAEIISLRKVSVKAHC
ncbi:XdhC family protein [Metabacillus litoralis]|uniref:XdhC family protein n=1 Tax=Metabacillus litoralis TaxID=152268 RepID=A0A5C6W4Q7_9BACI|nr:XdhC/CoxI family protein [Metabacillus litoralis]TXC91526.1 XdhC family protein [Metabacillus litoralis]